MGKPIGSDAEIEKATYPSMVGMEKSKELLNEITERAKSIIADNFSKERGQLLTELADFIKNTLSEGKYSNRKIIDLVLSQDFKELTNKDLKEKKNIVKNLIKDVSKQILSK